jgi:hypothetical protein
MARLKASQFTFRQNDNVGLESAELDQENLTACFYDRGDMDALRDCAGTRCVVIGRTGTGKSALLIELEDKEEHAVRIEPESLSLQYLSNSTILPQLEALGVSLGLFYKLLWRHIFAVEFIKSKYNLLTEDDNRTFLARIWDHFKRDRQKERSIEYLRTWGEEFWKDTEYRVREVTSKLESDVKNSLGAKYPGVLEANWSEGERYSLEEKGDVVKRLQEVVNSIQVRELTSVIKMLGESVFASAQPRFYLLVDRLDEGWVDSKFQYRLIKALVETINEMNRQMRGAKIIIAIRRDLLDRVIHETRDAGFQEEKYEPLLLNLRWSKEQLFEMLDRRVDRLIRRRYTGAAVSWADIMPSRVNRTSAADYLIDRTMYRPRDLIVFFNICIDQAVGKPEITAQMILHAEGEYSQKRLRSLLDEWHVEFPELEACTAILKRSPSQCVLSDISLERITDLCLDLAAAENGPRSFIRDMAEKVTDDKIKPSEFRARLMGVFYRVGLVGLRIETSTAPSWAFRHAPTIPTAAIKEDSRVYICPMFWRALGIKPPDADK